MKISLLRRVFVIAAVFAVIAVLRYPISAEEYSYTEDSVGSGAAAIKWDEFTASLPPDIRESLGEFSLNDPRGAAESVRHALDPAGQAEKLIELLKSSLPDVKKTLLSLIAVILAAALNSQLIPSSSSSEASAFLAKLVLGTALFGVLGELTARVGRYLEALCSVMNMLLPLMSVASVASGGLTERGVHSASVMLAMSAINAFNTYVMTPLVTVLFSLATVYAVSGEAGLGIAVSSFRKFVGRVWQIVTIVFSFVMGTQTLLAKSADSLASRGVRFAIGSFVPVAGGILSETYATVREGMKYVRQFCGIGGILTLVFLTVPVLVPVLMLRFTLFAAKTVSSLTDCRGLTPLLEECSSDADFIIGILLSAELTFTLSLILFAGSG